MYTTQKAKRTAVILSYLILWFACYWSYVDLNNKLEELETSIVAQGEQLKEIENDLKAIESELNEIESELDSLNDKYDTIENYIYSLPTTEDTTEQIQEEIKEGELEILAQLIEAEAGNQDFRGKCLVADVVLNRCNEYDMSIEDVIFAENQFSCVDDGGFDKAAWNISADSFAAAKQEYESENRLDDNILYFTAGYYNPYCVPAYVWGDHYFGY